MSRTPSSRGHLVRILARQSTRAVTGMLRPLVLGPAILRRRAGSCGPWHVDLADEAGLTPHLPASRTDARRIMAMHEACGQSCRIALALATPGDAFGRAVPRAAAHADGPAAPLDLYGWAVLYQLPGDHGTALVDPHDEHPDLPAFYECPHEFLDRTEYLAAKGIAHRPMAIVACPEDFERRDRRLLRRNRHFPGLRFRRPVDISRLA